MDDQRTDWFLTSTGRRVFVTEPRVADICVEDIAHSLSMICRFGGHCQEFYSVAQHSVWVSDRLPPSLARHGLLHDATEAYLGDVVRPLKRQLAQYQALEARWWQAICERFGLEDTDAALVKHVDLRALMTERRDLTYRGRRAPYAWVEDEASVSADPERIVPVGPETAKYLFLSRCQQLEVL